MHPWEAMNRLPKADTAPLEPRCGLIRSAGIAGVGYGDS